MLSNSRPASCSGRKTARANTAYTPTTSAATTASAATRNASAPLMRADASRATRWPTSSAKSTYFWIAAVKTRPNGVTFSRFSLPASCALPARMAATMGVMASRW